MEATLGAECLIVASEGQCLLSPGFAALERPVPAGPSPAFALSAEEKPKADPWPAGYRVSIAMQLPKPQTGRRIRRPYVAVWIEDADGKAVRTLTVWGNSRRWLPTMSGWWKIAKEDGGLIKSVTRATRAPGKYTLVWDGKDDKGAALPQGVWTIKVEVHREHGKHLFQTGKITCGADAATITLEKNAETEQTSIEYAKRK